MFKNKICGKRPRSNMIGAGLAIGVGVGIAVDNLGLWGCLE